MSFKNYVDHFLSYCDHLLTYLGLLWTFGALPTYCLRGKLLGSYNPLLPIVIIRTVNVPQIKQTNKLKAQTNPLIQQTKKQIESTN